MAKFISLSAELGKLRSTLSDVNLAVLAGEIGMPQSTLHRIVHGSADPRCSTVSNLLDKLRERGRKPLPWRCKQRDLQ